MANKNKNLALLVFKLVAVVSLAIVLCVNINFWLKIVLSICVFVAFILTSVLLFIKAKKEYIKVKLEQESRTNKPTNITLLDIYAILGIAPQYNSDGTLKDLYDLLGIEPQYDQNGNRILTIYEKLGINPRFSADAQELPYVLRIKNRVNSVVKLDQPTAPLVFYPRDKQILGEKQILPTEPVVSTTKEAPSIKKAVVVKKEAKKAPPKPAKKPPALNYGGSPKGVKIVSEALKETKITLFGIVSESNSKNKNKEPDKKEKPKQKPSEVPKIEPEKPKVEKVSVTRVTVSTTKTTTKASSNTTKSINVQLWGYNTKNVSLSSEKIVVNTKKEKEMGE